MTYPAKTIANYFISKSKSDPKTELTPMKLLKLVYIAHGWSLAILDKPLILESVDAWRYGPVIETLYHEFKKYGNGVIHELVAAPEIPITDEKTHALLDEVWKKYGDYTGVQLSNWTHENESPWWEVWEKENGKLYNGLPINNSIIQKYFKKLGNIS